MNGCEHTGGRRTHPARFRQAVELLQAVVTGSEPADAVMDRYFREHRNMGSRDRACAAETVYGCLRRLRYLEAAAGVGSPGRGVVSDPAAPASRRVEAVPVVVGAHLLLSGGWDAPTLQQAGFPSDAQTLLRALEAADPDSLPLEVRVSLPDWLAASLLREFEEGEFLALAEALNRPAPVDLRVNTLRAGREEVAGLLASEGYPGTPTPLSPWGLRRSERGPLFNTRAFRGGLFELQDEGSQLIAALVVPAAGERVVDYCAGSGGKTLHLGALMGGKGTLLACDVSSRRLDRLSPRLRRSGLGNVQTVVLDPAGRARLKHLGGRADAVLVDAPCSGSGTLRRSPDIKWRNLDLTRLVREQSWILAGAARLVRPGGRLVYATCSLLAAENQEVVAAFLATHPDFRRSPSAEALSAWGIAWEGLVDREGDLRLLPHRHGTDGFYGAVLVRA
jgi:16S rRNA (cytosine967-C5)-methyltransferase